jgi:hypothetical protein
MSGAAMMSAILGVGSRLTNAHCCMLCVNKDLEWVDLGTVKLMRKLYYILMYFEIYPSRSEALVLRNRNMVHCYRVYMLL